LTLRLAVAAQAPIAVVVGCSGGSPDSKRLRMDSGGYASGGGESILLGKATKTSYGKARAIGGRSSAMRRTLGITLGSLPVLV
jgi:hypothetical protein